MSTTPGALTDVTSVLSGLTTQAGTWYNAVTQGTPVITSASQAALNQASIQQAQQLSLGNTAPFLAGILANPTLIIVIFAILFVFVIVAIRK